MPNGRSDDFVVNRENLERILNALSPDAMVGKILTAQVDVSAISQMLSTYPDDLIAVEEQYESWYIIHLEPIGTYPPNIEKWVMVSAESPLFEELRRQHHRHVE